MHSRDRLLTALQHKEADRVPFDLGGTVDSGIHVDLYRDLLAYLGMKKDRTITSAEYMMNLAMVDDDVAGALKIDTVPVLLTAAKDFYYKEMYREGEYEIRHDAYGVKYLKPVVGGLYYDPRTYPLSGKITAEDIDAFDWPDLSQPAMIEAMRAAAEEGARGTDRAVVLAACDAGILERATWLRGFSDMMLSLGTNTAIAERLLDIITDIHLRYWEAALDAMADLVDVVVEADDLGMQDRLMISPKWYRQYIKPRHKKVFSLIKKKAPNVRIFFHSCGAISELIPDFIDAGIDILNPIQLSAAGMDIRQLKRDFGDTLTFWGGGVDTQNTLPKGSPDQIKDEVKRNLDVLAPGGGYVFSAVHNIQPDVPVENIIAMWEALQEYRIYD
jgi:uroporphyrinogen decarboxylase